MNVKIVWETEEKERKGEKEKRHAVVEFGLFPATWKDERAIHTP